MAVSAAALPALENHRTRRWVLRRTNTNPVGDGNLPNPGDTISLHSVGAAGAGTVTINPDASSPAGGRGGGGSVLVHPYTIGAIYNSNTNSPPPAAPLTSDELVVGCVTENTPKYLGQTLRLLQSIRWFGGSMAALRVVVGAVEQIDRRARRTFETLDAEVHVVPRFYPRNGSANRLQLFEYLRALPHRHFFMLDCDTIVVRDPLPLLRRGVFCAKIAPFPTVTHAVFERLFAHFGVPLPPRTYVTGYSRARTIPYFNAGVFCIPRELADRLVPEWRRYNALLAERPELVAPCQQHLHQAALSLALVTSGTPLAEAGAELNYQLNVAAHRPPPGYAAIDPYIIHYHNLVDAEGLLLPTPFPRALERIDAFNARVREERARSMRGPQRAAVRPSSMKQIIILGAPGSGLSLAATLLDTKKQAADKLRNSQQAVEMSVCVVRAFIRLRQFARGQAEIMKRLETFERKIAGHDDDLRQMFEALRALLAAHERPRRGIAASEQAVRRRNEGSARAHRDGEWISTPRSETDGTIGANCHRSGSRSYTYQVMRGLEDVSARFEAEGTVFGCISKKDFHSIPCIAPSAQVVSVFETLPEPLDDRVEIAWREAATLAALRDGLIPKLISGELRVDRAQVIMKRALG